MKSLRFWLFLLLIGVLSACSAINSSALTVQDAWARPSPQGAPAAAFYMTIVNSSGGEDVLLHASSDACDVIEIHRTSVDEEGVMRMAPVEGGRLVIPAGETALLEPGGLHLMCVGLQQPLIEGQQASLALAFEGAGSIDVAVPVRQDAP